MSLQHLFDAELRYQPGLEPLVATGEGELIGSGNGTFHGPKLRGTIRWTLFEQPGDLVCTMNPVAVLETEDGAQIRIEGRGYAERASHDDQRWRVAATLRFDTADERYRWLNEPLGFWEGEFDAAEHRARYRAFAVPAAASFTRAEDWRARRDRLDSEQRALYREILLAFTRGQAPTRSELAALAGKRDLDLAAALARFAELDLVHTDVDTGRVVVAYPFSGRPTAHRLQLAAGREAYAMCAVDALGVAAMLRSPVRVESRDPVSRAEIEVDVTANGDARWSPEAAVVFVGGRDGDHSISDLCCPVVNFFASPETAREYVEAHPELSGEIVGIPAALAGGRDIFEEALQ